MKSGVYMGPAGQLVEVRGEWLHYFAFFDNNKCIQINSYILMGWEYLGELGVNEE